MSIKTICGDCLYEMKEIQDNSIDLLFCDLPYGETSCSWDCEINLEVFWKEVNRICKERTPMFFCCSTKFGVSLINSNPKNFRYDMVWVKSHAAGFLNSKKMPMRKHEMVYVFYRKLPLYDLSSHKHKFIIEDKIKNKVLDNCYGENAHIKEYVGEARKSTVYDPPLPNSILEIKSEKGKHSTQKPVELIKWILKYYSKEGDIVFDPTMGSGSTGIACRDMDRKFIGIEKDEKIYANAIKRLFD